MKAELATLSNHAASLQANATNQAAIITAMQTIASNQTTQVTAIQATVSNHTTQVTTLQTTLSDQAAQVTSLRGTVSYHWVGNRDKIYIMDPCMLCEKELAVA